MPISKKFVKSTNSTKVTFKVKKNETQGAQDIYLLCEKNGWDPIKLTKQKNGDFKIDVDFETEDKTAFQYRYRLVMADGQEMYDNDWEADYYVSNPFGGENSVVDLTVNKK